MQNEEFLKKKNYYHLVSFIANILNIYQIFSHFFERISIKIKILCSHSTKDKGEISPITPLNIDICSKNKFS